MADHSEAQLKAAVLGRARRVVVPMDVSKLGINDFALVAPLDAVDMVITVDAPPELVELCAEHGVELVDADVSGDEAGAHCDPASSPPPLPQAHSS